MVPAALPLLTAHDRDEARRLVESQGLRFEKDCDELVGIFDGGRLVATAARAGYVLEMFAIDEAAQGGDLLGQLASALVESGRRAGHDALFVYTRPQHAGSFAACNFRLLVTTGEVALLEYGDGLERYLREHCPCANQEVRATPEGEVRATPEGEVRATPEGEVRATPEGEVHATPEGEVRAAADTPRQQFCVTGVGRSSCFASAGAVVINGNPFTRGHLYLVETAAARVQTLYLFVVREDRSVFPFDVRFRLAADSVRHLPNVVVLDTARYAVSAGTFPSYFLRRDDAAARLQMEVDARLFGEHIAPAFGIGSRFVGHEPYCPTTAAYNQVLARVLPECGIRLEAIERAADADGFISASRVRAALAAGDIDTVRRLAPDTTCAWIASPEGRALTARLHH